MTSGEIEQAAVAAGRALELAVGVASVRPRERMAAVMQRLAVHRAVPAVAEVLEMARS
ncbi:hypothetical protein ACFWOB_34555 [Streptomyces sp. NPDC058420]|uniref:hypothetical protein n=1 Tax=Streptomyces sp. NPDC058420 TaxID=3346489 RepID=UPI003662E56B